MKLKHAELGILRLEICGMFGQVCTIGMHPEKGVEA